MDLISREAIKKMLSGSIDKYNEELFEMTGTREDTDNFSRINSRLVEDKEISAEVSQLPSAFEGMTNGEVIKAVFPNAEVTLPREPILPISTVIVDYDENYHNYYRIGWWNAPYKGVSE